MKKSFKKLGFVSLAISSVLLGSMNATDLETYAALQKPSHVFGNYVVKTNNNKKSVLKDGKESGNSGDQASQQQAQKPLQATALRQKPLKTPLLLTTPQRLLIKPMKAVPTPL
ncbi:hypothetical protein N406_07425 [Helicobacter pylori FD577]|nr:hypothetical protein N406_07425 [Helicobacter pylori FD577]